MISRDTYIELTKFGIVGSMCFGFDLGLYYFFTEVFHTPTMPAKSISVAAATILNYYLNTNWTWGHDHRDARRFSKYVALYAVSGALNVISNQVFLNLLPDNEFQMFIADTAGAIKKPFLSLKLDKFIAVLGATVVGMVVNFIGQKLWVFRADNAPVPEVLDK